MLKVSTLRPGLLVSLKTSLRGNVQYVRRDVEEEHVTADGGQVAKWETERTIADAAEYEAARKAQHKASAIIRGVCARSAFGLLCPEADASKLEQAIADANKVADEFNKGAKLSRLSVYAITGRIAPDDAEAVRAINSEVRELMGDMQDGVKKLDAKAIREAASKAQGIGTMLSTDARERVAAAIKAARAAARKIVKAGEQAAQEIDLQTIKAIAKARTAFLDLDESSAVAAPAAEERAIDLPSDAPKVKAPRAKARTLEL